MLFILWGVIITAALVLFYRQTSNYFSRHGVKSLPPLPILGNMGRCMFRMEHFVDMNQRTYDAFPNERFFGRFELITKMIVIRDIELIKKITVKDFEHFLDHRQFFDEGHDPFFQRNLFALKGQEWKDMRSTLSPAFTSSKIKLMVPLMEDVGNRMVASLKKKIEASKDGCADVECKDLVTRYANDVIATCGFGLNVDSHTTEDNEFYEMGKTAANFTFKQIILIFISTNFPKFLKKFGLALFSKETKQFFRSIVMNTMQDREERNITRPDMIQLLMQAKKGQLTHDEKVNEQDAGFATVEESALGMKQTNRVWSDGDLIAQAAIFFIAGFETVSTGMAFVLYELARNPDVQDRLVKEIQQNHEKKGKLDYTSIQELTYLDMVISEVLRIWSPGIALDRLCTKDYNLGKPNDQATQDYIIRKGECLSIPVWQIHHDPQYFPDPEKFDPERFSDVNKHNIKPFTYSPFGLGPRNCIGSRFALCEIKVLVYQLILNLEISPSSKTCIPPILSTESFNLRLQGGTWLQFKLRN